LTKRRIPADSGKLSRRSNFVGACGGAKPGKPFSPRLRPGISSPIERRSAALDPLFDPTALGVGSIPMPDAGEQDHDCACFDLMAFCGYPRFKCALTLADVYHLVGSQDATLLPLEVVIDGMAPGWIGTARLYKLVAHRRSGAFPRVFPCARNPEINIIASHFQLLERARIAPSNSL
jgi:hypothetical protein